MNITKLINLIKPLSKANNMDIYTDGACLGNPGPGGYASILVNETAEGGYVPLSQGSVKGRTTNNVMEIMAVLTAIQECEKNFTGRPFNIYSDSQYVVKGINEWMKGWKKKNWCNAKGVVANVELWKQLDEILLSAKNSYTLLWVRGHNGNLYNEVVDGLANNLAGIK